MTRQRRFHLAGLDAESTHLYLLVTAPKEFDIPIGQITREVAGFVDDSPLALWERVRVRDEPFRRQLGAIQISTADSIPTDEQITDDTHRNRL